MFTTSHFSLKLPTYVETILTRQLHDLIVTKLCQIQETDCMLFILFVTILYEIGTSADLLELYTIQKNDEHDLGG